MLVDFGPKEKATRVHQLAWWSKHFSGLSLAEITLDRISQARDKLLNETFTRGKPVKDRKTGELVLPKAFRRGGATVNRYTATLSHLFSFAVKERRLLDRNPVSDIKTLAMVKRYSHLVVDHKAKVMEKMVEAKGL